MRHKRTERRRTVGVAISTAIAAAMALTGCGADSGPPTLTWYSLPDNGGSAARAQQCADASNGTYRVDLQVLPTNATAQREQLVRRLAAKDSSIDVMSLDVIFTAEFANAGFIRQFTESEKTALTAGMMDGPIETGTWDDALYAAPYKTNTQLLWYKKSMAAAAGVDPASETFTWDDMIAAAESQKKKIGEQGSKYEGYMVWINGLIASAGGEILQNAEAGREATPNLDSEEGRKAAEIIAKIARSSVAPSDLSVATEESSRAVFQTNNGMFMLNWPYVLAAARTAVDEGTLDAAVVDDMAFARYPRVFPDQPSAPPLGGANLAVGSYSAHPDLAVDLITCVVESEKAKQYMLDEGEPSPYLSAYDDPDVRAEYPNADLIRESINEGGPRPITPYYVDVVGSILQTWHPPDGVTDRTPAESDQYMADILSGRRLL